MLHDFDLVITGRQPSNKEALKTLQKDLEKSRLATVDLIRELSQVAEAAAAPNTASD